VVQKAYLFESTASIQRGVSLVVDEIIPYLGDVKHIMDFGCGIGTWSYALHKKGFSTITLIDHPKTPVEKLLFPDKNAFIPVNLDVELPPTLSFDLVICTEVLEHFEEKRALELLDYITGCSDLILFSAAIPGQGGLAISMNKGIITGMPHLKQGVFIISTVSK
jgi:hypothetical protein